MSWKQDTGITFRTPAGELLLDRGPSLKFLGKGNSIERRLSAPKVERPGDGQFVLRYETTAPDGRGIQVIRRIATSHRPGEADFVEEFALIPSGEIDVDLEIEWPFSIRWVRETHQGKIAAVFPTFDGRARTFPLDGKKGTGPISAEHPPGRSGKSDQSPFSPLRGQWRMCNVITDVKSHPLGLPVVQVGEKGVWLGAICADPEFGSLFELTAEKEEIRGTIRFRYAASKVPLSAGEKEVRRFGVWLAEAREKEEYGRSVDAYFRLMLPDVPPGPKWLHEIAMVGYDYLSDGGEGWERDARELARLLKPEERRRVAICLHGWYETLGGYSFDYEKKEIKPEWTAMARTRKVPMSVEIMRRKLKLARDLGFRVLVYFADGLNQDDGAASYRAEWDLVPLGGERLTGWTGPDTWGKTYVRNPAHPEVFQWYQDYLAALLQAFGPVVDGFVWDETFHVYAGTKTLKPRPAYCDRAMFALVKKLTAQVGAYDPQKVFLASDSPRDDRTIPGYAMVADGTYQDSGCWMGAWPFGLFPNWRNTLWSCNWGSLSRFEKTKMSVQRYGAPVAISNGWTDDRGPSEWTAEERDKILALFRQRLARKDRVRYLTDDGEKSDR